MAFIFKLGIKIVEDQNQSDGDSKCISIKRLSIIFLLSPSVYFLRGNSELLLSEESGQKISREIHRLQPQKSVFVYDPTEIQRKITNWRANLPWIQPHYAVKANPSEVLLADIAQQHLGFDCASREELASALQKVQPSKIVYSNSIKQEDDLAWAQSKGIPLTTADTIDELLKIKEFAPKMRILWRIAVKDDVTEDKIIYFSGKFGDDFEDSSSIHSRMAEIQALNVCLKGIHFHCGSGMHGSKGFKKAILLAQECIKIGRQYGHEMSVLDIGGGFPAGELNHETVSALKITENDPLGYTVIAEPGRHFCANSFHLLTKVIGKRLKSQKPCYHLNDSFYHTFSFIHSDSVSFDNQYDQFYMKIDEKGKVGKMDDFRSSTIFGMTCDGIDVIARNLAIPDLQMSDWLCWSGLGAYSLSCGSNFNGMKTTDQTWTIPITFHQKDNESTESESND